VAAFVKTPKQAEQVRLVSGPAMHVMGYGGSRSGKTFGFCRIIAMRAIKARGSRHAIWRYRQNHLMASIWSDTWPKMMKLCFPNVPYETNKVEGVIRLPNDSEIWMGGLDDKDRVEKVLGQEFATLYFNEVSQIAHDSVTTAMSRLAQQTGLKLKAFYDCNPPSKRHWSYKTFIDRVDPESGRALTDPENYAHIKMNPVDNRDNLAPEYLRTLESLPARKRARFLEGLFANENENALWNYSILKHTPEATAKLTPVEIVALLGIVRIVVAVDPAVTNTVGSDEHGIIVAGKDHDGNGYVLDDGSMKGKPQDWATEVARLFRKWEADAVVCEVNQGGDMVESTVRTVMPYAPVIQVRATKGKGIRAEPVSALYEQGKVLHVGDFETLEEQMCELTIDFDRKAAGYSPDRVDALVWAFTDLLLEEEGGGFFFGKC
jgi:phage terminase large subunit-like protein